MERLSYSQLNGYTGCGERYRLERVLRVPQRPAWALIGGSAFHETTENHDLREHGVDVPDANFVTVFNRKIDEAEEESGLDRSQFRASGRASKQWPDKENEAWWRAEGPTMLLRWINFRRNAPWDIWITPDGMPAVEIEFDLILGDDEIDIKGYIDRVMVDRDGSLIVLDIKTGSRKVTIPRQLGTYKQGILDKWPAVKHVQYGVYWDARTGTTGDTYPLNAYDMGRLEYQYRALSEARRTGLYLPNPSSMCVSCSVNEHCYEYSPEALGHTRPPWVSADDWQEMGGE